MVGQRPRFFLVGRGEGRLTTGLRGARRILPEKTMVNGSRALISTLADGQAGRLTLPLPSPPGL